jgi:hypothetical protein
MLGCWLAWKICHVVELSEANNAKTATRKTFSDGQQPINTDTSQQALEADYDHMCNEKDGEQGHAPPPCTLTE